MNSFQKTATATPSVDDIMRYENGEMDEAEMIEFFQRLVDTGLAWQLQGSYGRTANYLLRAGLITQNGETDARQASEYEATHEGDGTRRGAWSSR